MRPEIVVAPRNISTPQHRTVVLECVARGNPRPVISWSRADSKAIDVYNARVLGNGNLVISDVQPHHGGIYLCRASIPRTRNYTSAAANLTVLSKNTPQPLSKQQQQHRPITAAALDTPMSQ